jgi:hypothetical protein
MHLPIPGTVSGALVAGAYALWIAITMCSVLRCRCRFPGVVSIFAPTWTLFAPTPITYDYDFAFRAKLGNGELSPWKALPMPYTRALHHALWNPDFDQQIFLFRACQILVELAETNPKIAKLRRRAYDFLLSLIAVRAGEQPDRIQFMITCRCSLEPEDAEVVFLSADPAPNSHTLELRNQWHVTQARSASEGGAVPSLALRACVASERSR